MFIGIDWSSTKHDVCVLNEAGSVIATLVLPDSADGRHRLETLRRQLSVAPSECLVGIETAHSLAIDFSGRVPTPKRMSFLPTSSKARAGAAATPTV